MSSTPEATTGTDSEPQDDTRLGVIHSGTRYLFGFGSNFYGIWDVSGADGAPAQRFPANPQGRSDGWQRYLELEPSAVQAGQATAAQIMEQSEIERRLQRKGRVGRWVALGIVLAAVAGVIIAKQLGPSAKTEGGGATNAAGTAHVDITGGVTVSQDLQVKSFTPSGFDTLAPQLDASWTGGDVTLHIHVGNPGVGDVKTSELKSTVLDVTLAGSTPGTFRSGNGQCTMTLTKAEENEMTGSVACTAVPGGGGTTIDMNGTFTATD